MAAKEVIHGSICWNCKHACMKECKKPVEGWNAVYRPLMHEKKNIESWYVLECPNYEEDRDDVIFSHINVTDKRTAATMGQMSHNLAKLYYEERYHTLRALASRVGLTEATVRRKLHEGWTPEELIATFGKPKAIPVYGKNLKTGEIKHWNSIGEAVNDGYHFDTSSISSVLRGHQKTHRGWIFSKEAFV